MTILLSGKWQLSLYSSNILKISSSTSLIDSFILVTYMGQFTSNTMSTKSLSPLQPNMLILLNISWVMYCLQQSVVSYWVQGCTITSSCAKYLSELIELLRVTADMTFLGVKETSNFHLTQLNSMTSITHTT